MGLFCCGALFLPFFIADSFVSAQSSNNKRIKKITRILPDGEKTDELFEYSPQGKPVKIVRSNGLHTTYNYNEQNQLITYFGYDDAGAALSWQFMYDKHGNISEIAQKKTVSVQDQPIIVHKKACYQMELVGSKNRLKRIERYRQSGEEWKKNETIEFAYQADGRLVQMDITVIFSGNSMRTTFMIEQATDGNVKAIEIYDWHNGVKVKASEEHFTYHPVARSIESLRIYPEKDFDPEIMLASPYYTMGVTSIIYDDNGGLKDNKKEIFDTPSYNDAGLIWQHKSSGNVLHIYEWENAE